MATSAVEVQQSSVGPLGPRVGDPVPTNQAYVTSDSEDVASRDGQKDAKLKSDANAKANVKIFDNKTFVEAPLPKTNPWNKSVTPAPPAPVTVGMWNTYTCTFCLEQLNFSFFKKGDCELQICTDDNVNDFWFLQNIIVLVNSTSLTCL